MKLSFLFPFLFCIGCADDAKTVLKDAALPDPQKAYTILHVQADGNWTSIKHNRYSRVIPSKAMALAKFIDTYRDDFYTVKEIYQSNDWDDANPYYDAPKTTFELIDDEPYMEYYIQTERSDCFSSIPVRLISQFLE
jgi:hypothetical protein